MSRYDWINATMPDGFDHSPVDLLAPLMDEPPTLVKGRNSYNRGWELRSHGTSFATVYEGPGLSPHVQATGADAHPVGNLLRRSVPGLRISRADVCVDFLGGRQLFLEASDVANLIADVHRVSTHTHTSLDRVSGVEARTLYVGAKSSETQLRIYEKGKQDETYDPETIRCEIQVRPASPERKTHAGTLEPADLWGFSKWSRELSKELLLLDAPAPPTRSARVTDLDRSLNVMAHQYGNRLRELAALVGGDMAELGSNLMERVEGKHQPVTDSCDCPRCQDHYAEWPEDRKQAATDRYMAGPGRYNR